MTNSKYMTGRRLEYEVKHLFNDEGWYTFRSASSKGIADVIAIKEDTTLLIQCKYGTKPSKAERLKMLEFYLATGVDIHMLIAYKKPRQKIEFFNLDSEGNLEKDMTGWLIEYDEG